MRHGKGIVARIIYCRYCGSKEIVKNGFSPNGKSTSATNAGLKAVKSPGFSPTTVIG